MPSDNITDILPPIFDENYHGTVFFHESKVEPPEILNYINPKMQPTVPFFFGGMMLLGTILIGLGIYYKVKRRKIVKVS